MYASYLSCFFDASSSKESTSLSPKVSLSHLETMEVNVSLGLSSKEVLNAHLIDSLVFQN